MWGSPAPTIAFFGDSVTHGCFELYMANGSTVTTVYEPAHAYHKYVKDIFAKLYPTVQLNIINAGISGDSAEGGVDTTALLANKINHPDRDMNWLFVISLVETMFNE